MKFRSVNSLFLLSSATRRFASDMSNSYVKRTTLFKVPKEEDIEKVLKQYEILRKTAVKVDLLPAFLD